MLQNIANFLQFAVAAGVAWFVALWVALVVWTFRDIQSRSQDFVVQVLATVLVAIMSVPGFIVYLILRPSTTLLDTYERSLEEESLMQDVENRLACPSCHQRVQPDFLICPACLTQLKQQCSECGKVLQLKWGVCPYCTHPVAGGGTAPPAGRASGATLRGDGSLAVRERAIQPSLVRE
ncbi:MAG TPA: zinc ribbon domain-containing protein [Chloroflexota bacterium]|nr:zinc ribbon domain-containing protein [Chloroflexota bacterium]